MALSVPDLTTARGVWDAAIDAGMVHSTKFSTMNTPAPEMHFENTAFIFSSSSVGAE
jgi:hypothetical protein